MKKEAPKSKVGHVVHELTQVIRTDVSIKDSSFGLWLKIHELLKKPDTVSVIFTDGRGKELACIHTLLPHQVYYKNLLETCERLEKDGHEVGDILIQPKCQPISLLEHSISGEDRTHE